MNIVERIRHAFAKSPNIIPRNIIPSCFKDIIDAFGGTCFEARNLAVGARIMEKMINEGDTIWLGIAGAGILGGLGGHVIELIKKGFIDVICSTGAQVYHDLHFAFGLPVKQGDPKANDDELRKAGIVRVFDILIDEKKTLLKQDKIVRQFCHSLEKNVSISNADFNYALGKFVLERAKFPDRSFVAAAAEFGVPIFFDSNANHSIGMNNAALGIEISSNLDVLESAAIVYGSGSTGFVELGGGGPKNFIQQTGPTIRQILGIEFEGADRGLQITMALERDGGLSGATLGEGVTWGKYKKVSNDLVQVYGDYSVYFPIIAWYVIENCKERICSKILEKKEEMLTQLKKAIK